MGGETFIRRLVHSVALIIMELCTKDVLPVLHYLQDGVLQFNLKVGVSYGW